MAFPSLGPPAFAGAPPARSRLSSANMVVAGFIRLPVYSMGYDLTNVNTSWAQPRLGLKTHKQIGDAAQ